MAFPTETVYGLGADALNEAAVANIYKAKGRPSDNPLIVHVAKKEDIAPLVSEIPPKAQMLIDAFFPGPITVIMPKSERIGKNGFRRSRHGWHKNAAKSHCKATDRGGRHAHCGAKRKHKRLAKPNRG